MLLMKEQTELLGHCPLLAAYEPTPRATVNFKHVLFVILGWYKCAWMEATM